LNVLAEHMKTLRYLTDASKGRSASHNLTAAHAFIYLLPIRMMDDFLALNVKSSFTLAS